MIKPLGYKNYGSIPHLPNSRMGTGDHKCHEGQARIATVKARDRYDDIIVTEKLDGSNVGVARVGNTIYPLGRAGYPAVSSPYLQHRLFSNWVLENFERFWSILEPGERVVGEWLAQAHGTRYNLTHEPFVVFDMFRDNERVLYDEVLARVGGDFTTACLVHRGTSISVEDVMASLGKYGFHGALDPVEGAVWRVERSNPTGNKGERKKVVDFLVKYVRPDKVDGYYLTDVSGNEAVWNWGYL